MEIENLKEFEDMYCILRIIYKFNMFNMSIIYNKVIKTIVLEKGYFSVFKKVVKELENIVVKVSEGNKAANEELRRLSDGKKANLK